MSNRNFLQCEGGCTDVCEDLSRSWSQHTDVGHCLLEILERVETLHFPQLLCRAGAGRKMPQCSQCSVEGKGNITAGRGEGVSSDPTPEAKKHSHSPPGLGKRPPLPTWIGLMAGCFSSIILSPSS